MDEYPVRIARRLLELPVFKAKVAGLDRRRGRAAVHAHDAALGGFDDGPVGFAGDGVAVELAEVAHRHGVALVLEELLERLGIAVFLLVVAGDRALEGIAAEEQLRLLLALRRVRGDAAVRGEAGAADADEKEHADVGKAALFSDPW